MKTAQDQPGGYWPIYIVLGSSGQKAHLERVTEQGGPSDTTLCGRPIKSRYVRSGEDVCFWCDKSASIMDNTWKEE